MPPIIKDSDTLTATPETTARSGAAPAAASDSAQKPQPVALEIPITVNGARTIEGSDKREPFSESTKTVMVHGSGAVIRLASTLAAGQLLFLTNERTKKEVVCQVVKSKNYRNVSGYVELEFTEPAVGFWGMRFPSDRIGPAPQAQPTPARPTTAANGSNGSAAPLRPAAKSEQPATSSTASPVAAKSMPPSPVARNAEAKPAESKPAAPVVTAASKPATPAASGSSIVPPALDSAALLGSSKPKSGAPAVPVVPVPTTLGSETPLVEPWLKKREPVSRVPAAPPKAAPQAPAKAEEAESLLLTEPKFELARPSDKPASLFAPKEAPASLSSVDLSSIAPFFEVKPAVSEAPATSTPAPPAKAPAAKEAETEDLTQHTERLQDELSKIQFSEPAASKAVEPEVEIPSFPLDESAISTIKTELVHHNAAHLLDESAKSSSTPELPVLVNLPEPEELPKSEPPAAIPALESLQPEEVKIPAWLAPLARNVVAPASREDLALRERTKRAAELSDLEELTAPLEAPAKEEKAVESRAAESHFAELRGAESRVPQFGSVLPFEEAASARPKASRRSDSGFPFATIAAGVGIVLLAGGGWWYMNQRPAEVPASAPAAQASVASSGSQDLPARSTKEAAPETVPPAKGDSAGSQVKTEAANSSASVHAVDTPASSAAGSSLSTNTAARNTQSPSSSLNGGSVVTTAAASEAHEVVPAEEKKTMLGEVHLKTPKVSEKRTGVNNSEADVANALNEDQPDATTDPLGARLGIANGQPAAPAAPIAVGGEVKQAKLISSVPPVYPPMARSQHVSGGVTIDALIDANGRVTTMKVVSGPSLLQQAAMDALRQWKYQPATLNGQPVPMHLSVTIQFRLQ